MARDVCVVIVHGINTDAAGYSARYQQRVKNALPKPLRQHVFFAEVFWAEHLRDRQRAYLSNAEKSGLRYSRWRKLAMQALGDAATYQKTQWVRNSSYYTVQQRVLAKLQELETMNSARPVIFVGHSLGCHVISTLAWDIHTVKAMTQADIDAQPDEDWRRFATDIRNGSQMVRLDTFAGLITLGNNMPLFTFTFGPERVFPITRPRAPEVSPAFPGPVLPPVLAEGARWVNIYSPNDLLGYPMKCLNEAYRNEARLADIAERVEGPLGFIAPLNAYDAHVKYWTNRRVVRESAKLIREVIEAP